MAKGVYTRKPQNKICQQCNSNYVAYSNNSKNCSLCSKELQKKYYKEWKNANKSKYLQKKKEYEKSYRTRPEVKAPRAARQKHRQMLKNNAVPVWSDKKEIEYIYNIAQERGLEVDHIVPINSYYVCGLHTEDNLRCIPKALNGAKGNSYWPDMGEIF